MRFRHLAVATYLLGCCLIVAQVQAPRPAPKAKATAKKSTKKAEPPYDPDHLDPGEVACGRVGSKTAPPCSCVAHRDRIREEMTEKCRQISDRQKRVECLVEVPLCPAVRDAESGEWDNEGNQMPPQCKRSCRRARCECCHT